MKNIREILDLRKLWSLPLVHLDDLDSINNFLKKNFSERKYLNNSNQLNYNIYLI